VNRLLTSDGKGLLPSKEDAILMPKLAKSSSETPTR